MLDRRLQMVNTQLRTGGVVDKGVLAAFLDVPRQRFVTPEHESLAYLDRELPARGAKVVMLESDAGAAEAAKAELHGRKNATVVVGPLESGAAGQGPFDVIVVEGAFGVAPDSLLALLADPGRLVGIDASSGASRAVLYERAGGAVSQRTLFETKADLLDGFQPQVSFVF